MINWEAVFAVIDLSPSGSTATADVGAVPSTYVLRPTRTEFADGARDTRVFKIVMGGPRGISVADGATKTESELAVNAWLNNDITDGLCWPCPVLKEGSGMGIETAPGTAGCD